MRGCFSPCVRLSIESRLISPCLASNRRVQPGDHSSQARRGEHRLCQCLLHRCECRSTQNKCGFIKSHVCRSSLTIFLSARHFLSVTASQGYRQKDSYMASQGPLQHTIEDFWRMIWEWRSCSIVMLTELEERGQVCV